MGRLNGDVESFFQLQRTFFEFVLDGLAFKKGHHDEGLGFDLIDLIDGTDVGMIERCGRLRLAKETLSVLRVFDQVRAQKLQRHGTSELSVFRLVDNPHPAPAEFGGDLVVGDRLADHDGQIVALRDTWW